MIIAGLHGLPIRAGPVFTPHVDGPVHTHTSLCVSVSVNVTHSLGVLSMHGVAELQQSLKLIVPGERDDLQHGAKLTEDLKTTTAELSQNNITEYETGHRRTGVKV